ncbi:hypothetical protein [Actinoplanes sp. L3-i22]|uniref:hypothetical protein n=1 Tax=Actinoplanes sp. L3-i22 TaxID=2836373 RepID=UPI001C792D3A|nr:hypothetical protein [Actinoplanes sp. L3-i22]BCY08149.1 hypothetical protein L3i22_032370 [Actinoplanes sp. L3-i22]
MDAITGGAIVLTVDAVVFLMTALVGAPFLLFFLSEGDYPVGPIWPIATVWGVSAVLGSAAAAAAFLIGARGTQRIRQAGATTALATAAATGVLVATSVSASPILAAVSALFAAANLGAAKMLFTPEPAGVAAEALPAGLPEAFLLAAPLAEAEVRTRDTIEIQVREPAAPQAPDAGDDPEPAADDAATPEPAADPEAAADEEAAATIGDQDDAEIEAEVAALDAAVAGTRAGVRPRRRGAAALHTLGGVRLPPRALRVAARGRGR